MRSNKWSFPYPILTKGRDDYEMSSFSLTEEEHTTEKTEFIFRFSYILTCPGLSEYIANSHANVILFVESSLTRYRQRFVFPSSSTSIEAPIQKDALAGRVSFTAFIVANGDPHFALPEFNQAYYQGVSFDIRKGDILAESETISIPLDDSELLKPVSSIFDIGQAAEGEKGVLTAYDDHKISIRLPQDVYRKYDKLKHSHHQLRRTLSAIITLPALVEAIELIDSPNYEDCRWNRSLRKKESDQGISFGDEENGCPSYQYANQVYGYIVTDAINALFDVIEMLKRQVEEGESD